MYGENGLMASTIESVERKCGNNLFNSAVATDQFCGTDHKQ